MYLQDVEDVYRLRWSKDTLYRDVRHEEEFQLSRYSFELADVDLHRRTFESALAEGWRLVGAEGGRAYLPAYDWALKSSHAFNVLDARGAISVTERAGMILKIRKLACAVAKAYVDAAAPGAGRGRNGGLAWLSSSSRSASRRCRLRGCPASPSRCRCVSSRRRAASSSTCRGRRSSTPRAASCCGPRSRRASPTARSRCGVPPSRWRRTRRGSGRARRRASPGRTRSRSRTCDEGAKDPGEAGRALPAPRPAGRGTRDARGAAGPPGRRPARARVPEAHELGRLARRRAWRLSVRPADPLARLPARRGGRAVRHPRPGGRGEGPGRRGERPGDPRAPLPAEGRGRAPGRGAVVRGAPERPARAVRAGGPRRPHGAHRRRPRGRRRGLRRPRPARGVARPRRVPDGAGRRRAGGVPLAAAGGPRDGPRPSPEVHLPARRRRSHRQVRRDHQRRRCGRGGDRAGDGARGRGAPAGRVVLPGRGPEALARIPRPRPGRGDVPPGPRDLPRQVDADGEAGRGHGAAGRAGRRRARGGDAGGDSSRKPTSSRSWCASSPSCRA